MGGQFLLQSQVGVGTTVTFDVALALATKIPGGLPKRVYHLGTGPIGDELHPELAGTRAKLRGLRCLVVDGRPVRQQVRGGSLRPLSDWYTIVLYSQPCTVLLSGCR